MSALSDPLGIGLGNVLRRHRWAGIIGSVTVIRPRIAFDLLRIRYTDRQPSAIELFAGVQAVHGLPTV